MPICKRANFESLSKTNKNETFHDNDEVFYCEVTKEIFRDYEEYFRHVMVINSTVWQCETTGRENLTYAEALKSEKRARKKMELFKESLRAPVMLVVDSAKQSSMRTLNVIVAKFLRKRYFLQEVVNLANKSNVDYKIINILLPDETAPSANVVYEETENLNYKVQRVNSVSADKEKDTLTVPFANIRRHRGEFTTESLQMFIKYNVTRVDGILRPKPESLKKYVTDHNVSFKTIFIGKIPHFTPSKIKPPRPQGEEPKKQSTINKYLTKNNQETSGGSKATKNNAQQKEKEKEKERERAERAEQKAKSLKEQMEKLRVEKLEKLAQMEREKAEKRAKMMEKIEEQCDALLNKTDDLDRKDQRILPLYRPVKTYIDDKLVGDAFMLREFLHSFCGLLSGVEVFREKLNFYEMSRAFSVREVVGPLSDILLVLLGTIFDLQHEEEGECTVEYSTGPLTLQKVEPFASLTCAALTHGFAKRYFSFKINDLPIDALTLSEVLRLHLLSSGAPVRERADKWRIMYRNGYSSIEDPGYHFAKKYPRVMRALSYYPVYQLSFPDIIRIVRCLTEQILSYSSPINLIEERLEHQYKIRNELKLLLKNENRRLAGIQSQRQVLTNNHNQQCMDLKENVEEQKRNLEDKLNRKVADLLAQSEREHRKYENQAEKMNKELFDHLVLLGTDRAYRKYYVLESLPGIFIEHCTDSFDVCLSDPPTNMLPDELKYQAANLPRNRRDLRNFLLKVYKDEEKTSNGVQKPAPATLLDNKENQENHVSNGLPNGVKNEKSETEEVKPKKLATQTELYMCSGDPQNCIVHSENHSGRQMWSYIYEKEEIEALIESLNSLGDRESQLRDQLISLRELIFSHVKKCPDNFLSISNPKKFKNDMFIETNRKYNKSNYGLSEDKDMNDVMYYALVERVLQFEMDIYSGDLGRLKVKDMAKWRNDLLENKYDPQCKLQWGISSMNGAKESDIADIGEENKDLARLGYRFMPGEQITISEDDNTKNEDDLDLRKETIDKFQPNVRSLASALLQVEQAIERRFMKEPFGLNMQSIKNKELLEQKQKDNVERIKRWEELLMKSTSYSQVFLHLNVLHDCIVWARSTNKSLCQICRRGSDPDKMLLCDECNGGTHMFCMKPKMKSVPEGNWYCQRCIKQLGLVNEVQNDKKPGKPKRKFIMDDADNNSETSSLSSAVKDTKGDRLTRGRTRKSIPDNEIEDMLDEEEIENGDDDNEALSDENSDVEEDEDEQEENDAEEADSTQNETVENTENTFNGDEGDSSIEGDEAVCNICSYDGSDLSCVKCKASFHLECVHLRRAPRYSFVCSTCRQSEQSKRKLKSEENSSDEEEEASSSSQEPLQPPAKRPRSTRSSLRGSGQHNGNDADNSRTEASTKTTSNRRSLRRTGDDLPLNSAALYRLLDDIMKDDNAWPFLRPVSLSEVPDYHKVIKNPMDLAKVKSKLNMGEYRLNEEVMNDIQLVFKNCERYNDEDNEVFVAGTALEKCVIKQCKSLHLPYIPSGLNK